MLYWLSYQLEDFFGPFRLLRSHAFLLAVGTFLASFFVWYMLPKLWHLMPHDHGKAILGKDGMVSAGKPTGAGVIVTLVALPAILIAMPFSVCDLGVLLCHNMLLSTNGIGRHLSGGNQGSSPCGSTI